MDEATKRLARDNGALTERVRQLELRLKASQLQAEGLRAEMLQMVQRPRPSDLRSDVGPDEQDWSWVTQDMLWDALKVELSDCSAEQILDEMDCSGAILSFLMQAVLDQLVEMENRCPTCGKPMVPQEDPELDREDWDLECPEPKCQAEQLRLMRFRRGL